MENVKNSLELFTELTDEELENIHGGQKYVHDRWWIRMDLHVWTTVCSRRLNKVRSQI
ncbi:ComC/BlpC family leader-containing pheromone/bacteriocin [Lactococcus cremoris]|uniref:ComC/BlpC family leader-containing pheromone/bacteriocin n=1 Tax=Lactococcus lactis subsp. cremoris TaxID=1359 RepID=UPI001AF3BA3B|nr:ComC/BlpC family leader-containing pheromone/bacteriocin [Lactococcus cremoris]QRZ32894.1 ComC/BlpC family leader-containing pheromone/bacteriocin [Lactococcus cremoris]